MSSDPFVTVRYRWPDESAWSQVKVPGSVARVETVPERLPADCPNQWFTVSVSIAAELQSGICKTGPFIRKLAVTAPWGAPETITSFGRWFVRIPEYYPDGSFRSNEGAGFGCRTNERHPNPKIIRVEPHSSTSNCPVSGCRIKVFGVNDVLVYDEVRPGVCPSWEIDKPCPPDTLPCGDCCFECGAYISDMKQLTAQVQRLSGLSVIRGG